MQRFGIQRNQKICASLAESGQTYLCQECLQPLDLHSQVPNVPAHFTHKKARKLCVQAKKDLLHFQTQMKVNYLLSGNEIIMESFYPQTGWCCDLVWPEHRLAFIISPHITIEAIRCALQTCRQNTLTPVFLLNEKKLLIQPLPFQSHYFYTNAPGIQFYDESCSIDLASPLFYKNVFTGFQRRSLERPLLYNKKIPCYKNFLPRLLNAILFKSSRD